MSEKIKAFYFANKGRKLRYNDDRRIRIGRTHKVAGRIVLCKNGLHASIRLIDALGYAPDSVLYMVEMGGDIIHSYDKLAASERTYLASFNADKILREFARKQALINIIKIKKYCCAEDYAIIIKWLTTGDSELQSAARLAAWSAAWSAAGSAARLAARLAAESAAWSAAESAAGSAAWLAADKMLTRMVKDTTGWNI